MEPFLGDVVGGLVVIVADDQPPRAVEALLLDDVSFPGRRNLEFFGAAPDLLGRGAGGLCEDLVELLERNSAFDRWRFSHGDERG